MSFVFWRAAQCASARPRGIGRPLCSAIRAVRAANELLRSIYTAESGIFSRCLKKPIADAALACRLTHACEPAVLLADQRCLCAACVRVGRTRASTTDAMTDFSQRTALLGRVGAVHSLHAGGAHVAGG